MKDLRPESVPQDAKLEYHITLDAMGARPKHNLVDVDGAARLEKVKGDINRGNEFFELGHLHRAIRVYSHAFDYVRFVVNTGKDEEGENKDATVDTPTIGVDTEHSVKKKDPYHVGSVFSRNLRKECGDVIMDELLAAKVRLGNNLALCHLKNGDNEKAHAMYDAVLQTDAFNVKALYNKGKLLALDKCYEEAIALFEKAEKIEPDNKNVQTELKTARSITLKKEKQVRM